MQAHEFKQAFVDSWRELTDDAEGGERVIAAYQENPAWTRFMLGDDAPDG